MVQLACPAIHGLQHQMAPGASWWPAGWDIGYTSGWIWYVCDHRGCAGSCSSHRLSGCDWRLKQGEFWVPTPLWHRSCCLCKVDRKSKPLRRNVFFHLLLSFWRLLTRIDYIWNCVIWSVYERFRSRVVDLECGAMGRLWWSQIDTGPDVWEAELHRKNVRAQAPRLDVWWHDSNGDSKQEELQGAESKWLSSRRLEGITHTYQSPVLSPEIVRNRHQNRPTTE